MTKRKKILIAIGVAAAVLLVGFWFYWSPRAGVQGDLSFGDSFSIRWLIRSQTLQPILHIHLDTDGSAEVMTGVQRGPWDGGGGYYKLKKTLEGWSIIETGGWTS